MQIFSFDQIARLPEMGDNAAIAVRRLEAGTWVEGDGLRFQIDRTVLEGHRFAVRRIQQGEMLLSWGLPFGVALRAIHAGGAVINAATLASLRSREIDFDLPEKPNFEDHILDYRLDEAEFKPAEPILLASDGLTFSGYRRPGGRGSGTRNTILLLGLSSYSNGYVRRLEERLKESSAHISTLDGVAALPHTEGSCLDAGNRELVLRTLAGFVVHPNTAAVLIVERPGDALTWEALRDWMAAHDYPLAYVPHAHILLTGNFEADLARGAEIVHDMPGLLSMKRTPQPLSELKIALQCGGSDSFSGISGNPLVALAVRKLIRHGGSAVLSETPELVGAETYVLGRARNMDVARRFLQVQERFKQQVGAYGVSVEGNISGGNRYRGLYNITLKSIGAARKLHPDVSLDGIMEYAERLAAPGYYFMDSPGNDLESIAGQVAAGCNLVMFVTGNGSVTNFPFVPTIKVVTTTGRYNLMPGEMDVNAGRYLDGEPLQALGEELFEQTLTVARGQKTAGESAGHSQVHLWRAAPITVVEDRTQAGGESVQLPSKELRIAIDIYKTINSYASEQVGLILPGSLCSAQVARLFADRLNRSGLGREAGISRFVALPHTEGCGSSGNTDEMLVKTLAGYLRSPLSACAAVLEHGCERTLNDVLKSGFSDLGIDPHTVGWASVQIDGGLRGAFEKIEDWFRDWTAGKPPPVKVHAGMEAVRLGLLAYGQVSDTARGALGMLADAVAAGGGLVISALPLAGAAGLDYLEQPPRPGLYYMHIPTTHWTETHSGLGAGGVNVMLGLVDTPLPGHPLLPLLQVGIGRMQGVDLELSSDPAAWPERMLAQIAAVLEGCYVPLALAQGNVDFQLTRGEMGVSL